LCNHKLDGSTCQHPHVVYCPDCDQAYCTHCGKTWGNNAIWHINYEPDYPPYVPYYPNDGSDWEYPPLIVTYLNEDVEWGAYN